MLKRIIKFIKNHWLLLIIVFLGAGLRFWRLEDLTTFSGDQGYDFLIVKRMVLDGKFTMLGPKIGPYNELGNLYLGPAYYYLLAPFLFLYNFDPLGGAVLTVLLSLATIVGIYAVGIKFFTKEVAILASALYAFNTFLINQSRAPSNPHLIPFFSIVFIYSMLEIVKAKSNKVIWPIAAGISLGIMFQLHYLAMSLSIPTVFLVARVHQFRKLIPIAVGFLLAISPQIIFEVRHEFFISNLFLNQLKSGQSFANLQTLLEHLTAATKQLSLELASTNALLSIGIVVSLILLYIFNKKTAHLKLPIIFLMLVIFFAVFLAILYSGQSNIHYFAPMYTSAILLVAIVFISLYRLFDNFPYKLIVILAIIKIFTANVLTLDLQKKEGYTMPEGMNLSGMKKISEIIGRDAQDTRFNIASVLDGDTRARPYRYLVEVEGKTPQGVEEYPISEVIYLVTRDEESKVKSYTVWEVASFEPFTIKKQWDIQNGIKLYKLTKEKSIQMSF